MYFHNGIADVRRPMDIGTGIDKVRRIREEFGGKVDYEASCAYADSISDMSILEIVGHPVAVVPDAGLKEIAAERNWRVIYQNTESDR
jgi:phosphoserine phosphatase